jgi:hypothetical protein
MISSGAASLGVISIDGFGTENSVVVPVIEPMVAVTIRLPGANDPPFVAAGTSVVTENAPAASAENPPVGIPEAVPNVRTVPEVFGGKPLPVIVTV